MTDALRKGNQGVSVNWLTNQRKNRDELTSQPLEFDFLAERNTLKNKSHRSFRKEGELTKKGSVVKKFKGARVFETATSLLLGGMFVSMSIAALTIAVSAALNVI